MSRRKSSPGIHKSGILVKLSIALNIVQLAALLASIATSGFTVWKMFRNSRPSQPILAIRTEPLTIDADSAYVNSRAIVGLQIETSDGTYEFPSSPRVDSLQIERPRYFAEGIGPPKIELIKESLDRVILNDEHPTEYGFLEFRPGFILDGQALALMAPGTLEKIALLHVTFTYKYNEKLFATAVSIPVAVRKHQSDLDFNY